MVASTLGGGIPEKLVKWFLFSVVVALLPLIFAWLITAPKGISQAISKGELFIISATICAAAIGDLIGKAKKGRVLYLPTW
jgi:uncharacterized membrane protein